ncbi:hypothetical protein RND81_12G234900 [Saponaria officinalis]|uniref:Uncharacterized protein n=1 Tax=Saponaria officinalis TaxID=3572 RepID=A0AAW1HEJ3_SAPOF
MLYMDQTKKEHVTNLLENSWFFGNTLKNLSNSPKIMVISNNSNSNNNNFCSSSTTKEDKLDLRVHDPKKMSNNLRRTPSLPFFLGKDGRYEVEEEEEDEDEPRMGDLIRQAMPISKTSGKLDRMSSLPPCRVANEVSSVVLRAQQGGKLSRKVAPPPLVVEEKGMARLSRGASIDSSMFLPPKYTSKGTKQSASNFKNKQLKKLGPSNMNNPTQNDPPKIQTLDQTKPQKSPIDLRPEEVQGFKDLGFSVDDIEISPNRSQPRHGLQRGLSLDSKRAGPKPSSGLSGLPSVPKRADPKDSSSQDIKAQIKFWARAVASNVRPEC